MSNLIFSIQTWILKYYKIGSKNITKGLFKKPMVWISTKTTADIKLA